MSFPMITEVWDRARQADILDGNVFINFDLVLEVEMFVAQIRRRLEVRMRADI